VRNTSKINHVVSHRVFHTTAAAHSLLDIGLPGMSGIDLLKTSRAAGNKVPALILTACDDLEARVQGLEVGADDYVLKRLPCSTRGARGTKRSATSMR
jgi:DNA-binding response OmpR family regulator